MPYREKQLTISHSCPGTTARVNIFTLGTMDIVLRMAAHVGGKCDLASIEDGPEEKILYITFQNEETLEVFKKLCF